jgi:hypothetical protein
LGFDFSAIITNILLYVNQMPALIY